ncbi:Transcription initiation factor TFIID subunit 12, partial [Dissostichus eleginoides]
ALLNGTKLGMLGLGGMEEHQLRPTRQDFKANTISHTHTPLRESVCGYCMAGSACANRGELDNQTREVFVRG